jgi:HK97 family phage major capsid protein
MGYNDIISRDDTGAALVPPEISKDIIQEAPKQSVVLSHARRVPMSSKVRIQPVLNSFPIAHWVDGDIGLKQTTKQQWDKVTITAEELAAIVVVPDALINDANVPLWPEIQPYLVEAIGLKVDQAVLFGLDKPASWPEGIIPSAIARGNVITSGQGTDLAQDIAILGEKLAEQGYPIGTFASQPGLEWRLRQLRSTDGLPIYGTPLQQGQPSTLFGLPLNPVDNGAWDADAAMLAAIDWRKFVIGTRQDITWKWFDQGVISDDEGKVVLNLMQQDSKALRVVFRIGFQVANPINHLQADGYPAGVILPAPPPAPEITSITPAGQSAGETVNVNGANLAGATEVTVGGVAAAFTVVSSALLEVVIPASTGSGSKAVAVTTGGGTVARNYTVA